ncbi:fumarylacetoacetate hydrolase family protein [Deinococcus lacus]|uniref:Fumarylacetoacetate hydrolase family protein n=1 Tax=Deinococcus lacus TaxID=392561 RepID=A0ABW1Y9E4_9DEIO
MRLVRIRHNQQARWGRLEDDQVHLMAGTGPLTGETVQFDPAALLAPAEPTKIVCVGRNYVSHIREMGHMAQDLPREPGLFLKGPNALANPGASVRYPHWTDELHFEGELALVIGQRAQNLRPEMVPAAVLGYTCALDLTARDRQRTDLQWTRAKSADHFCPLGPWLVTDLDPTDLTVQTRVGGELRQDGRTSHMIFDVVQILTYVTRFMTLEPGDVVLTGTPDGVGPLQRGDRVEVEVGGIGTLLTEIEG